MAEPQIQYCTSADGTRIAFAVSAGATPILLRISGWPATIRGTMARYLARTGTEQSVVQFDRRGTGASTRDVEDISIDRQVEDISSIVAALGGHAINVQGDWDGTPIAIAFAAEHPEWVERMSLIDPYMRGSAVISKDALRTTMSLARDNWPMMRRSLGTMIGLQGRALNIWLEDLRRAISPDMAARYVELYGEMDVSSRIDRVAAPTLVVYRAQNTVVPWRAVQEAASRLQDCQLVTVDDPVVTADDRDELLKPIRHFFDPFASAVGLAADARNYGATTTTTFRTILFTDLVGHTQMMQRLGDEKGRDVLREHERITREVLKAHGGTEVKTMGDGFLASFGSVTKAVECAIALQRAFAEWNAGGPEPLHVRVGLNAGEPIEEEGDLFGSTVILASRIASAAKGGEILAADVVHGLCSGKPFAFSDRGEQALRGFENPVRLFEVSWR